MATIMIVDHKKQDGALLKSYLTDQHTIIDVSSSKEALEHLETASMPHIDLIMIHTQIPGTNKTGFYSIKPSETMKTAHTDSFISSLTMTAENVKDFINQAIMKQ